VIPNLTEIAEVFGVSPLFVCPIVAASVTSLILFAQSVARWFEDRNP
jgi:hypothetical protein